MLLKGIATFSSKLLLTCAAAATSEEAVANELPFSLPGSYALAHSLILSWTKQQRSSRSHPWKDVRMLRSHLSDQFSST